ncbi:MAG: response regulator transcription factor [Dehalococcoidia bacterium]|nr:response regulator transcription factor [Dehalococcoidia bacterium]
MAKVLIVDDEPAVLTFLKRLFDEAGHRTSVAADGAIGLREFFSFQPDVAVVDMMMPSMGGEELCRRIREVSYSPIVALTAMDRVDDKVRILAAGADDYVTKPVSGRELLARVEACLRRSKWPTTTASQSAYSDSRLSVDFSRREVYVDGERKELTPIEYSLLSLFVRRTGEALSAEFLLTQVWGREYDTLGLVKWHVSNLRKKLENRNGRQPPISTVRGYGYRYERPTERPAPAAARTEVESTVAD